MAHQPRWTMSQVTELFNKPLIDLLFEAQQIHRQHFDPRPGAGQHPAVDQNRRLPGRL